MPIVSGMATKQKLVTKAEFSRIVGINQGYLTRLTKTDFANAMVGPRIDMAHTSVKSYITKRRAKERKAAQREAARSEQDDSIAQPVQKKRGTGSQQKSGRVKIKDQIIEGSATAPDDQELAKFGDMKLKDILRHHGTMTQFKDLLSATKLIEDIIEKRIKNAKISGDLISREHVHTFIFGAIEVMNIRLLQDAPRTIAARVISAWESGETSEQVEVIICDLISSQLQSMKKEVTKGMKSA